MRWLEVVKGWLLVVDVLLAALYLVVLLTLVNARRHARLGQPFYSICISTGIADIAHPVHAWLAFRLYPWGWLFGFVPATDQRLFDRSALLVQVFLTCVQVFGLVALTVERITNTFWPEHHNKIWRALPLAAICVVQWVCAALVALPCADLRISWQQANESVQQLTFANRSSEAALAYYSLASLTLLMLAAFVLPCVYALMLYYAWHYRHNVTNTINTTAVSGTRGMQRHELQQTLVALAMCLCMVVPLVCAFGASLAHYVDSLLIIYALAHDTASLTKPLLLLTASRTLRTACLRQLRCAAAEALTPSGSSSTPLSQLPITQTAAEYEKSNRRKSIQMFKDATL